MQRSVFDTTQFRWSIWVVLFLVTLSSSIILWNTPLKINFAAEGWNYLFRTVLLVPIGILTASIPIIALVVANHRSQQTAVQIRELRSQNSLTNYYKNREEFIKYTEEKAEIYKDHYFEADLAIAHGNLYPHGQTEGIALSIGWVNSHKEMLEKLPALLQTEIDRREIDIFIANERFTPIANLIANVAKPLCFHQSTINDLLSPSEHSSALYFRFLHKLFVTMEFLCTSIFSFSYTVMPGDTSEKYREVRSGLMSLLMREPNDEAIDVLLDASPFTGKDVSANAFNAAWNALSPQERYYVRICHEHSFDTWPSNLSDLPV